MKIKSEKKQKKQFCPNKKGCLSTSFQEIRDEREKSSKLLYRTDLRAFVLAPWDCLLLLLGRVHVRNDNLLLACFVELFSFFSRCRLLCLCSVYWLSIGSTKICPRMQQIEGEDFFRLISGQKDPCSLIFKKALNFQQIYLFIITEGSFNENFTVSFNLKHTWLN